MSSQHTGTQAVAPHDIISFNPPMHWRLVRFGLLLLFIAACGNGDTQKPDEPRNSPMGQAGGASKQTSPQCQTSLAVGGGWEVCDREIFHRPSAGVCPGPLPARDTTVSPGLAVQGTCAVDNDCTELPFGYCLAEGCAYRCLEDSDCASDQVCFCIGGTDNLCIEASCTTNADCEGASGCVASQRGAGNVAACQEVNDQCERDTDCAVGQACLLGSSGQRSCQIPPSQ